LAKPSEGGKLPFGACNVISIKSVDRSKGFSLRFARKSGDGVGKEANGKNFAL